MGKILKVLVLILLTTVIFFILNKAGILNPNKKSAKIPHQSDLTEEYVKNYKADLNNYFTVGKAPSIYLIPKQWKPETIPKTKTTVTSSEISFQSSWGKSNNVSATKDNIIFKFDGGENINFFKQDESSALIKTLQDSMTTSGRNSWPFPVNFSEKLSNFFKENKISTLKDVVDYALAIDPRKLLTETDNVKMIIEYSLLQKIKRVLVYNNGVSEIYNFNNGQAKGYLFMPISSYSKNISLIVFAPSGNIYTANMYNTDKFSKTNLDVFLSSLNINN